MRKGKFSGIRIKNNLIESSLSKKDRKKRNERYAKYVANEREAERSPRVKRNGKILNRFSDSDVSK